MLTKVRPGKLAKTPNAGDFAIVASKYNERFVESMVTAAEVILRDGGAKSVQVVRVPGAFEIPVVAAMLARSRRPRLSAIICLGVILRGETAHADLIASAVTSSLAQLQINHELPVIHEVLLLANEAQAEIRCLGKEHNRGAEAALTALAMAALIRTLRARR
jgi:6,7-dimethyl-8-ribityllumazine synthase